MSGPRDSEPDGTAFPPDQFPDAVHVVTFVVFQARFAVPLYGTEQEPALPLHVKFSVGGGELTFTATDAFVLPPGPEQFTVYVCDAVRLPVDCEPDVPVQFGGVTVHDVLFVDDQEMVAAELYAMLQDAEPLQRMEAVGAGAAPTFTVTVSDAEPPGPVQEMV